MYLLTIVHAFSYSELSPFLQRRTDHKSAHLAYCNLYSSCHIYNKNPAVRDHMHMYTYTCIELVLTWLSHTALPSLSYCLPHGKCLSLVNQLSRQDFLAITVSFGFALADYMHKENRFSGVCRRKDSNSLLCNEPDN